MKRLWSAARLEDRTKRVATLLTLEQGVCEDGCGRHRWELWEVALEEHMETNMDVVWECSRKQEELEGDQTRQ